MRVALFVTCLVDLMRPRIGFAAIKLLEAAGCEVVVPEKQTCCGQPAFNAGDRAAAAMLAKKTIAEFEGYDYVVAPSGSCADQMRTEYPGLLADDAAWHGRAVALASRVYELTDFLVNIVRLDRLPGKFAGSVTYHDSCTGLRSLGIKEQPRRLLAQLPHVALKVSQRVVRIPQGGVVPLVVERRIQAPKEQEFDLARRAPCPLQLRQRERQKMQ